MKEKTSTVAFRYVFLCVGGLLILLPFYLTLVSMFKSTSDMAGNFFGLPHRINFDNLKDILSGSDYYMALRNSTLITITSLFFMAVLLPMASYPLSRRMNGSKAYKFLYYFFVMSIFVPFQVKMIPMVKMLNEVGLLNTVGITILYIAYSTSEGVFLFVGYLSSIPTDMEEAATIDGASTLKIFTKIMYPLLRPITATVLIKNALWVWNDFFMPLLVLSKSSAYRTLPLYQYMFRSENTIDYPRVFTVFFLSMMPMIVLYCFLQKQIIGGMMSGAIKG